MAIEMLFESGRIGPITVKNRFVRAATSETMSQPSGIITDAYRTLYRDLARGGAGLILTGHMFVHPRGRYFHRQAGIHSDDLVPSLRRFTSMIHVEGGTIFAELGHAGSQCRDPAITPLAPSPVENFVSARAPAAATEEEIGEAIASFAHGARRAREAGFDGVHIHAGHGYLISEFSSPHGNRRDDDWGGDAGRRSRFVLAVYRAVRNAVGRDFPVTVKLGMADSMEEGGLQLEESLGRAAALEDAGVDAIEVSVGIMHLLTKSAGEFVGVTPKRAFQDLVAHRLFYPAASEAYFLPAARAARRRLKRVPLILVGGIRTTETMGRILAEGAADYISMARPFIREPDLPNKIIAGKRGLVDCVSCNVCMEHEGHDPLQCWRIDKQMLLKHLLFRLRGGGH